MESVERMRDCDVRMELKRWRKDAETGSIEGLVLYVFATIIFGVACAGIVAEPYRELINNYSKNPIQVVTRDKEGALVDINSDGVQDRIIQSSSGLYQEQFGYFNKEGGLEYLTSDQVKERLHEISEKEFEKLRTKIVIKD